MCCVVKSKMKITGSRHLSSILAGDDQSSSTNGQRRNEEMSLEVVRGELSGGKDVDRR